VNSGIIGVLCRAFDIVPFASVLEQIEAEFDGKRPKANSDAARLAYEHTTIEVA
jgi:Pyruvate/2-oxoacid:ferredoxin oxidoreductase gamma subunit